VETHAMRPVSIACRPFFVSLRGPPSLHRDAMVSQLIGALGIAGVFTLLPGRIVHAAVLGRSAVFENGIVSLQSKH
jgi:uncharacterized membrane protein